jgi:hypothetical protein
LKQWPFTWLVMMLKRLLLSTLSMHLFMHDFVHLNEIPLFLRSTSVVRSSDFRRLSYGWFLMCWILSILSQSDLKKYQYQIFERILLFYSREY